MDPNAAIDLVHALVDATQDFYLLDDDRALPQPRVPAEWLRAIQHGQRAILVLRQTEKPEEFIGLSVESSTVQLQAQLWVSVWRREDAESWQYAMHERFPAIACSFRTPRDPRELALTTFPELFDATRQEHESA